MTTIVETYLETLINATSWTVESQGLTKTTKVYGRDHPSNLQLDRPYVEPNNCVIIIYSAVRSNKMRFVGALLQEHIGVIRFFTHTYAKGETAATLLDTIAGGDRDVLFHIGGIHYFQDGCFTCTINYQVTKLDS